MKNNTEVRVSRTHVHPDAPLAVFIEQYDVTDHKYFIAQPIVMEENSRELFKADGEPTLRLTIAAAQQLMDDLWMTGLRPSEGSGSAGCLKATQSHLNDMRKIVFKDKSELKPI